MATTVWRPRVRIAVPDIDGANVDEKRREESTTKGTKRKRAPPTKGPCEHGVKKRSRCKVCSACPHGRVRSLCKECGGSQICEHGRQRNQCKECGGKGICEHGRQRHTCKECRAVKAEAELLDDVDAAEQVTKRNKASPTKGPCEHGVKWRSRCKVCSACPHGRDRYYCKECGGSGICEHGRIRYSCKECGGAGICEHGRQRSQCKECGGASICEHGRERRRCKECGGSRRGQRTADVSRGPPSQDTEKHARQDTDVDEPSEASENEEPDDPSEVDAAEAAHATTRLIQSGLPGLARYQDAVSSIELRNRRAVIVKQTRALKRRLVGDVDPTAQADEDERDDDERETEDEGEQRRCVIM